MMEFYIYSESEPFNIYYTTQPSAHRNLLSLLHLRAGGRLFPAGLTGFYMVKPLYSPTTTATTLSHFLKLNYTAVSEQEIPF